MLSITGRVASRDNEDDNLQLSPNTKQRLAVSRTTEIGPDGRRTLAKTQAPGW